MKRRINEDFLPPAPVPMAVSRPASSRMLRSAKPENKQIAVVTTSTNKPTQRMALPGAGGAQKPLLGFKTKSITTITTHQHRRRAEDELDEEAAPLLLDEEDAVPIGENLAPNDNIPLVDREAVLCRQIELLNLETIPALELKLKQSEASRLEDVRKLVFAVKSERAQHAKQLEALQQPPEPSLLVASLRAELAETRQQLQQPCACASVSTLVANSEALQQQLFQCKEQALRDFVEAQTSAKLAAQQADQLSVLLEQANQDLVKAKLEIGRLARELDTERSNVQLQREYMIKM
ncbi:hypothetical protein BASA81_006611 [Batrachochytrium salamandrivorans]|nr:hypothetical protein BASA81_006611 [Batrachochytrium salamandrivorans]